MISCAKQTELIASKPKFIIVFIGYDLESNLLEINGSIY